MHMEIFNLAEIAGERGRGRDVKKLLFNARFLSCQIVIAKYLTYAKEMEDRSVYLFG